MFPAILHFIYALYDLLLLLIVTSLHLRPCPAHKFFDRDLPSFDLREVEVKELFEIEQFLGRLQSLLLLHLLLVYQCSCF